MLSHYLGEVFFFKIRLFVLHLCFTHMYVCAPPVSGALRNWKRLSDSLELELWMVVKRGCWELDPSPLASQQMLLTAEASPQPPRVPAYTAMVN